MNDFTKDELDQLRASRCYHLDDNSPYEDELFMKLNSMIDDYCEHEPSGEGWCPGLYDKILSDKEIMAKDLVRIYECNKCGEFFK